MHRGAVHTLSFALSLALLAGCGANPRASRPPAATYGQGQCDVVANSTTRTLGNFDIQVNRTQDPKQFELWITPVVLVYPGEVVSVTIAANESSYRELINDVVLKQGRAFRAGVVKSDEFDSYTALIISSYQPGVPALQSKTNRLNICPLIQPGDGVQGTTGN